MRRSIARAVLAAALVVGCSLAATHVVSARAAARTVSPLIRTWTIRYLAHDGLVRPAYLLLPAWYGPRDHPRIPLVISPHGRGIDARTNARLWGNLPAAGRFAVVNPEGQGRRLKLFSWGDPGQIADLARMPAIVERELPWLRIDPHRIYAFGGSMGGQETLLLVAHHPQLLAGAAAFDAPTNMIARYHGFEDLPNGTALQQLAGDEIGGPPTVDRSAYVARSPIDYARRIAFSGVPLQIWWSYNDKIVVDQEQESGLLYREIKKLNHDAPVVEVVGYWAHTAEMTAWRRLPIALGRFGLLPRTDSHFGFGRSLPTAQEV